MLEALRRRLARIIAPKAATQTRMYANARPSRLLGGAPLNSSADQESLTSLRNLRTYSRQLVRDASFAKRPKMVVMNNVIGTGIGLQSQVKTTRNDPNGAVNKAIEDAFEEWSCAEYCHTGGGLHFHDLERALMGEVFEAGEAFVRLHYRAFGDSKVPLALELIEAERIADESQPLPAAAGNMVRMGVEVDKFYRPVAYFIRERHQGEQRPLDAQQNNQVLRIPADEIIHLKLAERWPQTRGVPWLHTVIRKLQDIDGYSEAEIVAARGAASYVWWIKGGEPDSAIGEQQTDGTQEMVVEPGMAKRLAPGEDIIANTPNRPNAAMDPFMRMMLREVAAGCGTSYESLSRDYSQSNYSSSRLALLDDRDLWRVVQKWFVRAFRARLHPIWLQQAVLSRAIPAVQVEAYMTDAGRYCSARFKPRGWTWIDPSSDLDAFEKAVRCGFTTVGQVITQTGDGLDLEDVLEQREEELKAMRAKGLIFDTDPTRDSSGKALQKPTAPDGAPANEPAQQQPAARVVPLR
jgi:lambda family phage portal protein